MADFIASFNAVWLELFDVIRSQLRKDIAANRAKVQNLLRLCVCFCALVANSFEFHEARPSPSHSSERRMVFGGIVEPVTLTFQVPRIFGDLRFRAREVAFHIHGMKKLDWSVDARMRFNLVIKHLRDPSFLAEIVRCERRVSCRPDQQALSNQLFRRGLLSVTRRAGLGSGRPAGGNAGIGAAVRSRVK